MIKMIKMIKKLKKMNIMTKEEAKAKLREAESDLRLVNAILERHEQRAKNIQDEIAELEAIMNKPDRWQDSLVQPEKEDYFYLKNNSSKGMVVDWSCENNRNPEHAFRTQEQAELIKEKMLLMQEMYAFAHVRNEGWMPDWRNGSQIKWGLSYNGSGRLDTFCGDLCNDYIFGIVVKSEEIAEEMLEIFGERIEKFYNKQY